MIEKENYYLVVLIKMPIITPLTYLYPQVSINSTLQDVIKAQVQRRKVGSQLPSPKVFK
jgi:hypothetical protein